MVLFFLYFWADLEKHSGHEGLEYTCGPVRASPKINKNGSLHKIDKLSAGHYNNLNNQLLVINK